MKEGFASTPEPPYYAVIFTARRTAADDTGYGQAAARMLELAARQPGYLGVEHARGDDGLGITVSYWDNLESIAGWKAHLEHREAQRQGHTRWYEHFELRVARIERASSGPQNADHLTAAVR